MSIQNRVYLKRLFSFFLLIFTSLFILGASGNSYKFTSSRGLRIRILEDKSMNFIHAQLMIFYRDKADNPALSYITLLNLFNKELNKSRSSLLNTLRKLGNDFVVEQKPDHLLLKINWVNLN